jgi:two-component system sensor histidine kinase/response regulator
MKKILVIDDELCLREMVREALTQKGFEVIEAEHGAMGIEKARKELPDLILCDVRMQRVDGYLTLSTLRNEPATAAIPFILMTGLADNAGMRHGMELGADDYLPKPFTVDGLYAAVETRLKKAQLLRQEAEKKLTDLRDSISLMLPHELRTPLNGILAYGEMLSTDAATLSPHEIAEMGQVIHESGKRLAGLIENFLVYAQIELVAGDPQRAGALLKGHNTQAAKVISASAREQAQSMRRVDDLVLELCDTHVAISQENLTKIVDELVANAFKFSKPGTPVRVSLSTSSGVAVLAIADRGQGMTPEQITRIGAYMQFQRKFQEQQGSGLGLIIARRLTELHNGALAIRSEQDAGTTVTVRLPSTAGA